MCFTPISSITSTLEVSRECHLYFANREYERLLITGHGVQIFGGRRLDCLQTGDICSTTHSSKATLARPRLIKLSNSSVIILIRYMKGGSRWVGNVTDFHPWNCAFPLFTYSFFNFNVRNCLWIKFTRIILPKRVYV